MQVLPGVGLALSCVYPTPVLSSRSTSCPACSVGVSMLTHGHASLRPRNRPWFGAKPAQSLELEPATQGSQELAHLGLGGKLRGVGGEYQCMPGLCLSARQAPGAAFQSLLQSLQRKALEGDDFAPCLLCPSQASRMLLPLGALTPPGPGSAVVWVKHVLKHLLCKGTAGLWANVSQGTRTLSMLREILQKECVGLSLSLRVRPVWSGDPGTDDHHGGQNVGPKLYA